MSLPQRSNINSFDAAGKINYQLLPPVNPLTDWDNPSLARAASDVAGLGLTAPRIWVRLTLASTTGALVVVGWQAVWGNVTMTPPIPARSATGAFTLTLPTVVSDEYDASTGVTNNITVNLLAAHGSLEGSTFGHINCSATANLITIYTANAGGTANDLAGVTVLIVGY